MLLKIDTKISELSQAQINESEDYLIKFREEYSDEDTLQEGFPYSSEKIKIESFINYILSSNQMISGQWTFEELPEQTTRFGIDDYINNILLNTNNRSDCVSLTGNGYYSRNQTLFPPETSSTWMSSLSVSQYSIPNLDYLHRIAAYIYGTLRNEIENYIRLNLLPSKVGDIIFTTTLNQSDSFNGVTQSDTNHDAKVRNIYGHGEVLFEVGDIKITAPNTKWQLIAEKRLISGTDTASKVDHDVDNGTSVTISKDHHFKKHSHTKNGKHSHSGPSASASVKSTFIVGIDVGKKKNDGSQSGPGGAVDGYSVSYGTATGSSVASASVKPNYVSISQNTNSGIGVASYSLNIEQAYKNVYVWKRIV